MLGNIKFIGELGKLGMLHEGILHQCIKQLLGNSKRVAVEDLAEDMECLCHMMRTVGRRLDHDKAKSWVDQYFDRMVAVTRQPGLPSRIKFMLQDVIELRDNNWVPRRVLRENGPKTIHQVHTEAAREMGVYIPPSSPPSHMSFSMGGDLFGRPPMNGVGGAHRSGTGDLFGPMPPSPPTMGVGPGTIPMDPFGPPSGLFDSRGGRGGGGRGFPSHPGGGGGFPPGRGSIPLPRGAPVYKLAHQKTDREREHDDDDFHDDERPGSGGSGGESRGRGGYHARGGSDRGRGNYRGSYNPNFNQRPNNYNRNPNYQPRGGFNPDGGPGRGEYQGRTPYSMNDSPDYCHSPDRNFNDRDGFNKEGGGSYNRSGYRGRGGYEPREGFEPRGGRHSRGGFEPRGGYNPWGGFDNPRGGFDNQRGGFDNRRGGFDNPRGGFDNSRGGLDNRGGGFDPRGAGPGFDPQQQQQKDLEKLPPRFRKQLEAQHNGPADTRGHEGQPSSPADSPRGPQAHTLDSPESGSRSRSPYTGATDGPPRGGTGSGVPNAGPQQSAPQRESFFGPPSHLKGGGARTNSPNTRSDSPPTRGGVMDPFMGGPGTGGPPPHSGMPFGGHHGMSGPYQMRSPSKQDSGPDISLRPVRMPTAFRPNIPSMLPKSAQGPPSAQPTFRAVNAAPQATIEDMIPPAQKASMGLSTGSGPQPTNLTIKTVSSQDKLKDKDKKQGPTQDELKQSTDQMLNAYLENNDMEVAINSLRCMKPPKSYLPELVTCLILRSLDRSDTDREAVSRLLTSARNEGIIDSASFMQGFEAVLEQMRSLETDVPLVKSYVSKFAAHALLSEALSLAELARPMQGGKHYPLFLLCLQQAHKIGDDEDVLVKAFNESKLELQSMLPECDQTRERMLEILDDRGLSFLLPLLCVESDLKRQLAGTSNDAAALYKWAKEKYSPRVLADPGFINILFSTILDAVTKETTLAEGVSTDEDVSKELTKKEKDELGRFKLILAGFIHDSLNLQVEAICAVQVFCHNHKFPKGMLLRMFMALYDLEVIDEDAFLSWKEDLRDEHPGKGKALFQVNKWLIWLQQAESESSDDE